MRRASESEQQPSAEPAAPGRADIFDSIFPALVRVRVTAGAIVEFKSKIGPYASLGSNSVLSDFVTVDTSSQIGQNCTLLPNVSIGRNVVIEPGSVVDEKIPSDVKVAGNPAAVIRKFTDSELRDRISRRRKEE